MNFPAWLRRAVTVSALVGVVLAAAGQATYAQPSLEEIEAELDAAWRELEPLIEQHNEVRSELEDNQEASAELEELIAPLAEEAREAEAELAEIASRQYQAGPMSTVQAVVASGSPSTFVDRVAMLEQLTQDQRQRIDDTNEVRVEYEQQQAEIDALIEEQEEQEAELAERAESIETELEELEELREEAERRAAEQEAPQQPDPAPAHDGSCPAVAGSGPGAVAAEFACTQLGKPYSWGAAGPDAYDCSGLTQQAWAAAGVSLTHFTGAQWNEGRVVSRAEAAPGDLVFFYSDLSHVGLYIGNGMMVHAPRAGEVVSVRSIDVMPVNGFRRPA